MEWSQNFIQLLKSFNAERVRYLAVGGYAVSYHGHPRYTAIWIYGSSRLNETLKRSATLVHRAMFCCLRLLSRASKRQNRLFVWECGLSKST
ncbi:MAG: hypothetical protein ACI8UO_005816 [Verrucomicrobiales bacterium]|jgi:hypothetical protein